MTEMLASVRNLQEALTALELGADLIDLKEPARGALGALDHAAVRVMVHAIDRSVPVSATIGDIPKMDPQEMVRAVERMTATGVDYIKIGFFAGARALDCARALSDLARRARLVAVIFADEPWSFAPSPSLTLSPSERGLGVRDCSVNSTDEHQSPSPSGRGSGVRDSATSSAGFSPPSGRATVVR